MTRDEIQAAIDRMEMSVEQFRDKDIVLDAARAYLQSAQVKAETVDIPEGFRMSPEQNIVWEWADAHGLTLVVDECNDLLWRLEKTK